MPWTDELTALSDVLSMLYRDQPEKCALVVEAAGLDLKAIDLHGSPQVTWRNILSEADKHGKVQRLLDAVSREYGDNPEFARVRAAYPGAQGTAGPRNPTSRAPAGGARKPRSKRKLPIEDKPKLPITPPPGGLKKIWAKSPFWLRCALAAIFGALFCILLLALFGASLGCTYLALPDTFRLLLFGAVLTTGILGIISGLAKMKEEQKSLRLLAFVALGSAVILFIFMVQLSSLTSGPFPIPACPTTPTPIPTSVPTATSTSSVVPTATLPPQPSLTQTPLPSAVPSPTGTPIATPLTPALTRQEIDNLLGEGNWFCFPDRETGLGLYKTPPDFRVAYPIRFIDAGAPAPIRYQPGEIIQTPVSGTAELEQPLPLVECPVKQIGPLLEWQKARSTDKYPFDKIRLDALFGKGNWDCLLGFPSAVRIQITSLPFPVVYPILAVDGEHLERYALGDTLLAGRGATAWLPVSLPIDQCPFKITVLDPMDSLQDWITHTYTDGSVITASLASGTIGGAIELSYHLPTQAGWVLINRALPSDLLTDKLGILFSLKGLGNADTLEMKLIDSEGITFGVQWNAATDTGNKWNEQRVGFDQFTCWWTDKKPDNRCPANTSLKLQKVIRLEFAISAKSGDEFYTDQGASGVVTIGDLRLAAHSP